jgi:hypothetical protein
MLRSNLEQSHRQVNLKPNPGRSANYPENNFPFFGKEFVINVASLMSFFMSSQFESVATHRSDGRWISSRDAFQAARTRPSGNPAKADQAPAGKP